MAAKSHGRDIPKTETRMDALNEAARRSATKGPRAPVKRKNPHVSSLNTTGTKGMRDKTRTSKGTREERIGKGALQSWQNEAYFAHEAAKKKRSATN